MNKFSYTTLIILLLITSADVRSQTAGKVEVGAQFTSLTLPANQYFNFTEPGFGGRVTYNLNDNLAVEGEANFFLNKNVFGSLGRATQGQFGVKAGKRYKNIGVFAKARPGFLTVGDVFSYQPGTSISVFGFPVHNTRVGRETHFTTDLGGVLEFYPSRKTVVRFDAGDTIVRFGPHLVIRLTTCNWLSTRPESNTTFRSQPVLDFVLPRRLIQPRFRPQPAKAMMYPNSKLAFTSLQCPWIRRRASARTSVSVETIVGL